MYFRMFLLSLQKENRAKIWLTLFPKKDRFVGYALSVFSDYRIRFKGISIFVLAK
ncbi:hypothetical protein CCAND95_30025 [Capnocytophaga canis]|nr:hypothetical protein CCAND95_30025 [Capnocytophaga canis]